MATDKRDRLVNRMTGAAIICSRRAHNRLARLYVRPLNHRRYCLFISALPADKGDVCVRECLCTTDLFVLTLFFVFVFAGALKRVRDETSALDPFRSESIALFCYFSLADFIIPAERSGFNPRKADSRGWPFLDKYLKKDEARRISGTSKLVRACRWSRK